MDDEFDFWLPSEYVPFVKDENGIEIPLKRKGALCVFSLESFQVITREDGIEDKEFTYPEFYATFKEIGTENKYIFEGKYSLMGNSILWISVDCPDVYMKLM